VGDRQGQVAWFENDGLQNFTERVVVASDDWVEVVIAVDIDADGDLDIVAGTERSIELHRNNGQQDFALEVVAAFSGLSTDLVVGDVDDDGDLDIAYTENQLFGDAPSTSWLENLEVGGFREHTIDQVQGGGGFFSVAIADMNADGFVDILTSGDGPGPIVGSSYGLRIHANDGNQSFGTTELSNDSGLSVVEVVDMDLDGDNDMISTRIRPDRFGRVQLEIGWYQNEDLGQFRNWTSISSGTEIFVESIALEDFFRNQQDWLGIEAGDIDQDGDVDVVTSNFYENRWYLRWFEKMETGFVSHLISEQVVGGQQIHIADMDADGDLDLVDYRGWYENDGLQQFTAHEIGNAFIAGKGDVLVVDINQDGLLDHVRAPSSTPIHLNNGGGLFLPDFLAFLTWNQVVRIDAGDVDSDGDIDFVTLEDRGRVEIYSNAGNNRQFFPSELSFGFADYANEVFIVDLNQTGLADVVVSKGGLVQTYESQLTGEWIRRELIAGGDSVVAADIDLDGKTDIVSAGDFNRIVWMENDSTGLGDLNRDGTYSCDEIDNIMFRISRGDYRRQYDLNSDSELNLADRDVWLAEAGAFLLGEGRAFPLGDANLDGVVDVADFNVWNSHKFTETSGWCQGDFNADGVVDVGDFNVWNANKFTSARQPVLDTASPSVLPFENAINIDEERRLYRRKKIHDAIFGDRVADEKFSDSLLRRSDSHNESLSY
jgi:hypothetical protein